MLTPERAIFLSLGAPERKYWSSQSTVQSYGIHPCPHILPLPWAWNVCLPDVHSKRGLGGGGGIEGLKPARGVLYRRSYYPNDITNTCRQSLQEQQPPISIRATSLSFSWPLGKAGGRRRQGFSLFPCRFPPSVSTWENQRLHSF